VLILNCRARVVQSPAQALDSVLVTYLLNVKQVVDVCAAIQLSADERLVVQLNPADNAGHRLALGHREHAGLHFNQL
jgi:hypothetical protein